MVPYLRLLLLATACVYSNRASATPHPEDISAEWVDSTFAICMKKTYPDYPGGVTDPNVVLGCKKTHKELRGMDPEPYGLPPREIPDVNTEWVDSAFASCMKKTYPDYPGGVTDPNVVLGCKKNHKERSDMDLQPYDLAPRQIPGLALALGADCDRGSDAPLPKNFMIATEIRAGAANWCNTMKTDLINLGLGQIDQTFNNAVTKTANQLHGKKGVAM